MEAEGWFPGSGVFRLVTGLPEGKIGSGLAGGGIYPCHWSWRCRSAIGPHVPWFVLGRGYLGLGIVPALAAGAVGAGTTATATEVKKRISLFECNSLLAT